MANGIHIEGVTDCIRMFEKAPENVLKISKKAFREASKATAKQIRQGIPKRWRRLVKYKVMDYDGKVAARIGLYNGHQLSGYQPTSGRKPFDWFKAYWANYGTLKNRDPEHQFMFKVKNNVKRRRNATGQKPMRFFEGSIAEWDKTFMTAFENEVMKHEQELYDR